jgi:hypothetical protein
MGRGGGMGMGRRKSAFGGAPANQSEPPTPLSKEEELQRLKAQANDLRRQIEAIESHIEESEKK